MVFVYYREAWHWSTSGIPKWKTQDVSKADSSKFNERCLFEPFHHPIKSTTEDMGNIPLVKYMLLGVSTSYEISLLPQNYYNLFKKETKVRLSRWAYSRYKISSPK